MSKTKTHKNKILVVYNTCGLTANVDPKLWINDLFTFQTQRIPHFWSPAAIDNSHLGGAMRLVHADCGSPKELREEVYKAAEDHISYYHTPDPLPVQQTFNHAVQVAVQEFGEFEYYCYISSGIALTHPDQLYMAYHILTANNNISKLDFCAIRRPGYLLPTEDPENPPTDEMHPPATFYNDLNDLENRTFLLRPGQRVNWHTGIFSHEHYKAYGGRVLPDAYAGNGSESIYPYLAAAIGKQHHVLSYRVAGPVHHVPNMDGSNQFLEKLEGISGRQYVYDWSFRKSLDFKKLNADGADLGLLTDEPDNEPCYNQVPRPHFDENGLPKTEEQQEELFKLLSNRVFVGKDVLDYNDINYEFSP